jgi:PIN domain nuclease of toxin-antitoxin system
LPRYVADTHTILWHLGNDPRLSPAAGAILRDADEGRGWVYVSAISFVEMVYLVDRGRLDASLLERAFSLILPQGGSFSPVEIDLEIVRAVRRVPRAAVPDMPDRIIVATALRLGLPLISRDEKIRNAGVVRVIW